MGGFRFLDPEEDTFCRLKEYFEEIETIHNERELTYRNMPPFEDYFPQKEEGGEGFFIECDVHIPPERHDYLQFLPPAPTHTGVYFSALPPHMQEMYRQRYGEVGSDKMTEKLIASLSDKENIVLHHTTASIYAKIGAKITPKRAVRFVQSNNLRPWIEKATLGRKQAADNGDELLVAVYKLIINSVFGNNFKNFSWLSILYRYYRKDDRER